MIPQSESQRSPDPGSPGARPDDNCYQYQNIDLHIDIICRPGCLEWLRARHTEWKKNPDLMAARPPFPSLFSFW